MLRLKAVEEELEQKKVISGQDNLLGFKKSQGFSKNQMKLVEEHRQERRGLEEAIGRLDRYLRISRIDPLNEENNWECPDTRYALDVIL